MHVSHPRGESTRPSTIELSRAIRFQIPLGPPHGRELSESPRHNTFAGWPAPATLSAAFELRVTCRGVPDPDSGYLISIGTIDEAVRDTFIPRLAEHIAERRGGHPARVLLDLAPPLLNRLPVAVARLEFHWSPFSSALLETTTMHHRYLLRQQFDFAAAHRLFVSDWSRERNASVFGRCTNVHGHNYRIEVTASAAFSSGDGAARFSIPDVDEAVASTVLATLDHSDLNADHAAFENRLPSVENIAQHCFQLIEPAIAQRGGRLEAVEVWETEKTSCRCTRAESPAE